jgi:hypothetical protein
MNARSGSQKRRRGRPRIRFQPDVRITIRLCPDRDDDLLTWLSSVPERQRAGRIRQVLRSSLNGSTAGRALDRRGPASDEGRGEGERLSAV